MSVADQEPNFDDPTPRKISKQIGPVVWEIREASIPVGISYRNITTSRIRMQDGKVTGVGDIADADMVLMLGCIFSPEGKAVTKEILAGWRDEVREWAVDKIKEMSPSLETKLTVVSIDKQIARLQEQRKKLTEDKSDEGEMGKD